MKAYDEFRTRAECLRCCMSCTGEMWQSERWADDHEREFPGHSVDIDEVR